MQYKIQIHHQLCDIQINRDDFDSIVNPFSKLKFFQLLEESKVIGHNSGWIPLYFCAYEKNQCVAVHYTFLKNHSYGEYIFDWAWADFYQRNGIPYYPKMISAIPFSPINAPKFVFHKDTPKDEYENIQKVIVHEIENFIKKQKIISGYHYLFADYSLKETFSNYIERTTIQYHFENHYDSFDDFLQHLKARKRKNIKKEREEVKKYPVDIKKYENEFPQNIANDIYDLYLSTIDKKYSQAYLNFSFFEKLFNDYKENIILYVAYEEDELIAMSLFLNSQEAIYGRYWGMKHNKSFRYLHFEMCYYLGIEYCIENKIPLFEAGAQGEQKLLRGFKPVEIKSFHKISIDQIHQIIKDHIQDETKSYLSEINRLNDFLPYK